MGRIEDKKQQIEKFLFELKEFIPNSYDDYRQDIKIKAFCERYFEKIIEAINDLAILIIKDKRLPLPSEDEKAFEIISNAKIISENLASKLKQAKGMRNRLAHQYDKIDDEIIFEAITTEIIKDASEFLECVK